MAAHVKPQPAKPVRAVISASITSAAAKRRSSVKRHPTTEPIAAAKAKTHLLQLLDQVQENGQPITITKRGRVVAQLISASDPRPISKFDQIFGRMAGTIKITGDIVSPDWEPWGPEWR